MTSGLRNASASAAGEHRLEGRNIGLISERTSTRDASASEVAAHDEGAQVSYLGPGETQLGYKKSIKDTAHELGRIFDGIEYCGSDQETVETLAAYAGVPVWNGRTDTWHPTQMLADILTVTDHCAKPLSGVSLCYLGDGRSNTANSLLVTGGLLGMDLRVCAPPAMRPTQAVQLAAGRLCAGRRPADRHERRPVSGGGRGLLVHRHWPSVGGPRRTGTRGSTSYSPTR